MIKRTRRILFFICAILFLLAAPSVILYSQGYRLNWEQKKLVKTGAFYFKVAPKGATIFINGKLAKKTDFFFGSVLIENLTPKKYLVEIKKTDYQQWKKNLEIKETQVTETKNIVLVPEQLKFELLDKEVIDFFASPKKGKMILKKSGWSLKLYDFNTNIKSHLIDEDNISKKQTELLDLIWSADENKILLKTIIDEQINYFVLDLLKSPILSKKIDYLSGAENIKWHPNEPQKIFFQKQETLFEVNMEEAIPMPVLTNIIVYQVIGNDIYWLDENGFVYKAQEKINFMPLEIKQNNTYEIIVFNSQIFLKENKNLYFFNKQSKSFEQVGNDVQILAVSPDFKKLCFGNDFEIWILFLEKETSQPQKEAGTKLFLTRFSEKIGQLFWWNNHYVIVNTGSKIKIIEIDDRDEIQAWNLSEFNNSKIYFNEKDRRIYVLSEERVFLSEKL